MHHDVRQKFLAAYDAYADAIYRHCYFRVFIRGRAEELMQETFMKTWEYLADAPVPAFEHREILALRYVDDMNPKEIGAALGITANAASVRIHRALAVLKEHAKSDPIYLASGADANHGKILRTTQYDQR